MNKKALPQDVERFARLVMDALGTPLSASLKIAIEKGEWDTVARCRVDPNDYTDAELYFRDAQAASLLRKCSDLPTQSEQRRKAALANWELGEQACFRTNLRLVPYLEGVSHPSCDTDVLHHLEGVRKIIKSVLGRAPSLDDLDPRHGPGATFSDPSVRSTYADKMNSVPSMTPSAYWFLLPWGESKWGREAHALGLCPSLVRGNRFATAPKDALKDRPIGAEPSINIFYQLALGKALRSRLARVGIDLNNGQGTHRQVACEASITGHLATLDLSNASDTVAYSLVKLLLPADWFELLDELRSPFTFFPHKGKKNQGDWRKLEKFSSMGNGYTFELETLLFYAATKYVSMCFIPEDDQVVLVYGDDIICDVRIVQPLLPFLSFLGFTINKEKSFWSGPFRESCGGDYFSGRAVRPYFMKEFPCEPQQYIAAANAVRRVDTETFGSLNLFRRAWFHLLDQLPLEIRRCRGPSSLGDVVVHDEQDRWVTRERSQTVYVRVYRSCRPRGVRWSVFDPGIVHACALLGLEWNFGYLIPRKPRLSYKVGWRVAYGTDWVPTAPVR